jgi:outer membrane autotransporter protein
MPIYRYETPLYAVLPALGRDINLFNLATFHDRRGDQGALGLGSAQQVWSRIAVSGWNQSWGDTSQPEFNGNLSAFNLGVDLGIQPMGQGGSRRWGAMFNFGNGSGSVKGLTYATENNPSGSVQMQSYGFSLYGTLVDPSGWYVDVVGGFNWFDAQTESRSGINGDTEGWGWTISIETGYPIKLGGNWSLEPELQLIGTGSSMNGLDDGIAAMSFDSPWAVVLRSGVRLAYQGRVLQPFLRANFWTTFSGNDGVTYDGTDNLATSYGNTTIQLGGGVVWQISQSFGIEASIDYLTQSQNSSLNGVAGNLQLRLRL